MAAKLTLRVRVAAVLRGWPRTEGLTDCARDLSSLHDSLASVACLTLGTALGTIASPKRHRLRSRCLWHGFGRVIWRLGTKPALILTETEARIRILTA
jgi:hypothetical protein